MSPNTRNATQAVVTVRPARGIGQPAARHRCSTTVAAGASITTDENAHRPCAGLKSGCGPRHGPRSPRVQHRYRCPPPSTAGGCHVARRDRRGLGAACGRAIERILTDAGHEVVAGVARCDQPAAAGPTEKQPDPRESSTYDAADVFTDEGIRAAALLRKPESGSRPVLVLSALRRGSATPRIDPPRITRDSAICSRIAWRCPRHSWDAV